MPTVDDYRAAAPFSLEELLQAANRLLPLGSREVTARTVRYYIQRNLLPPPTGGPKFAKYSIDHLRELIELRNRVEAGEGLAASPAFTEHIKESISPHRPKVGKRRTLVERIQLAPGVTLELDPNADDERVREALQFYLYNIT